MVGKTIVKMGLSGEAALFLQIMRWMQSMGDEVKRIIRSELPDDLPNMDMILIDEMWHYTPKTQQIVAMDCYLCRQWTRARHRSGFSWR